MMFSIVPIIIVYLFCQKYIIKGVAARRRQRITHMTIKDLARLSGYSVGTVSRALNGLPNVSEQARSAILALAQERGYQLNTNAKYLKQIHSSGIVAVVTGTSNELFAQMIERIQQTLPTDRYPLTVDYVDENEDPVERALHLSREKKPAGLLFLGGDRGCTPKTSVRSRCRPSC